jgi:hypothetical protein
MTNKSLYYSYVAIAILHNHNTNISEATLLGKDIHDPRRFNYTFALSLNRE